MQFLKHLFAEREEKIIISENKLQICMESKHGIRNVNRNPIVNNQIKSLKIRLINYKMN